MKDIINYYEYRSDAFYFMYSESHVKAGNTNYRNHSHKFYEMMYVSEGEVEYLVESRRHTLKKGDVLLTKPGEVHCAHKIFVAPSIRFCLGFMPQAIENGALAKRFFDAGDHLSVGANSVFADLMYSLLKKLELSENGADDFIRCISSAMILTLQDTAHRTDMSLQSSSPLLEKTINYISLNIREIKSADCIADALFFSKSHLGHIFKKEMNISIMEYVRIKRWYSLTS